MSPKNNLSIRLSESVVFLRGSVETTVTGRRSHQDAQPAMLRGLLTLTLVKPTKISSIEICLDGKTTTAWPEGVGARRLEVTEEHSILSASKTYFRAGNEPHQNRRRTASIGPGLTLDRDDDTEESSSTHEDRAQDPEPEEREERRRSRWLGAARQRMSFDIHSLMSRHNSETVNSNPSPSTAADDTPPYSPMAPHSILSVPERPFLQTFSSEHYSLRQDSLPLSGSFTAQSNATVPNRSAQNSHFAISEPLQDVGSSSSSSVRDTSLSRRPSEDQTSNTNHTLPSSDQNPIRGRRRPRPLTWNPGSSFNMGFRSNNSSREQSRAPSLVPSPLTIASLSPTTVTHTPSPLPATVPHTPCQDSESDNIPKGHDDRGKRRRSRFSLALIPNAILNVFKESTRASSPTRQEGRGAHDSTPTPPRDGPSSTLPSREPSLERIAEIPDRGRSGARGEVLRSDQKEKQRKSALDKLTGALRRDDDLSSGSKRSGEGWKEFRKGTYTYPISFAIPSNSPPTLHCDYGSVTYRLKATVHRPGTFAGRLSASRDVTLIASPGEDDLEESDNIVVQREWDGQMLYVIVISGRAFPIGSTIPLQLTFMPLTKLKIYRISAVLEEKVDYYTQFKRIARSDNIRKFELLSIRYMGPDVTPVLPLTMDYLTSPLRPIMEANGGVSDDSENASNLMGPGPWSFQTELKLPKSCARMHFTNKHKRSNIAINHLLKIVIRVERGDDEFVDAKTGKRKHFDIVVQTPLHILSCRCNPEWNSLPRYSSFASMSLSKTQTCPCTTKRPGSTVSMDDINSPLIDTHNMAGHENSMLPSLSTSTTSTSTAGPSRVNGHPLQHTQSHSLPHPHPTALHPLHPLHLFQHQSHTNNYYTSPRPSLDYSSSGHGGSYLPHLHGSSDLARVHSAAPSVSTSASSSFSAADQGSREREVLFARNTQFARLVAGEESEAGEAPPRYENVVFHNGGSALTTVTTAHG